MVDNYSALFGYRIFFKSSIVFFSLMFIRKSFVFVCSFRKMPLEFYLLGNFIVLGN